MEVEIMKVVFQNHRINCVILVLLSLLLISCGNTNRDSDPTGQEYCVDEELLGKECLLDEIIHFSAIEKADHVVRQVVKKGANGNSTKSITLNAEEGKALLLRLKDLTVAPDYDYSTPSIREEAELSIYYEFKMQDGPSKHISVFSWKGKAVLAFDMDMISDNLRHPAMRFFSENASLVEELNSY